MAASKLGVEKVENIENKVGKMVDMAEAST